MAGPNDTFNKGAGRDPDPMSFPPITAGPVASLLGGRELATVVSGFMQQMEDEIKAGKRKREDGYRGILLMGDNKDRNRPPHQLILQYEDQPGTGTGTLTLVQRAHYERDRFIRDGVGRGADLTGKQNLPFPGAGYYITEAAVFQHDKGRFFDAGGRPASANGRSAVIKPYAAYMHGAYQGQDDMYQRILKLFDPEKVGLSRDLAEQVRQGAPKGAVQMDLRAGGRPGAAPGGGIPGSIDIDSVPDATGSPPKPSPGSPPAQQPPAQPTVVPLVGSNGQVNVTGLANALGDTVRNAFKGKPGAATPRPDQEGP